MSIRELARRIYRYFIKEAKKLKLSDQDIEEYRKQVREREHRRRYAHSYRLMEKINERKRQEKLKEEAPDEKA